MPRLSICIPVYNFADFLSATLDSVLSQAGDDIEIVIFDGGSTDRTPDLVQTYCAADARVRYHRADQKGGIDADLASCVALARGAYCWLFSGDDVMQPGALSRVLHWTDQGGDVYIGKHVDATLELEVVGIHEVLRSDGPLTIDFADPSRRLVWFDRALTTEAFFSFMSGIVVKTATWRRGRLPEQFARSCWGHVARLFELAPSGLAVTFVPEIWLVRRGDNDSFADRGIVNRFAIAIEGYSSLAATYFGADSPEAFHVRRTIRNEFGLANFMFARRACRKNPDGESSARLAELHARAYADEGRPREWARRWIYEVGAVLPLELTRPTFRIGRALFRRLVAH